MNGTVTCRGAAAPATRGKQRVMREYVLADSLARCVEEWLDPERERTIAALADRARISTRAINKVLNRKPEYSTIFLADKLLTAMERHVIELDVVTLPIRRSKNDNIAELLAT